jgi:hypothetical protein
MHLNTHKTYFSSTAEGKRTHHLHKKYVLIVLATAVISFDASAFQFRPSAANSAVKSPPPFYSPHHQRQQASNASQIITPSIHTTE